MGSVELAAVAVVLRLCDKGGSGGSGKVIGIVVLEEVDAEIGKRGACVDVSRSLLGGDAALVTGVQRINRRKGALRRVRNAGSGEGWEGG